MDTPLVSIIVPVYNAERFLNRCVDSILTQDYKNFELILVNDGSTDRSGEICQSYARQDPRVRVIEKANAGVSAARNDGMDLAQGVYLQFLDSDDWMTPDSTKLLVQTAQDGDVDMVIADFYRVSADLERVRKVGDIENTGIFDRRQYADYMMENPADFYYGVIWNKFYKRSIIEAAQLRMDPTIDYCEDFLFNMEYVRLARTFRSLQVPIYYYVKVKGSLVSQSMKVNKLIKTKLNVFEYYNQFYRDVYDESDYESRRIAVYGFLFSSAGDGLVLPIAPSTRKLGKERPIVLPQAASGSGPLLELYQKRSLLDRYCRPVAAKHDLSLRAVQILWYLHLDSELTTVQSLAVFSGLSKVEVNRAISELAAQNLVRMVRTERSDVSEDKDKRDDTPHRRLVIRPEAEPVLQELNAIEQEYEATLNAGLSAMEQAAYERLENRRLENLRNAIL